jgi:hypothetical protein
VTRCRQHDCDQVTQNDQVTRREEWRFVGGMMARPDGFELRLTDGAVAQLVTVQSADVRDLHEPGPAAPVSLTREDPVADPTAPVVVDCPGWF